MVQSVEKSKGKWEDKKVYTNVFHNIGEVFKHYDALKRVSIFLEIKVRIYILAAILGYEWGKFQGWMRRKREIYDEQGSPDDVRIYESVGDDNGRTGSARSESSVAVIIPALVEDDGRLRKLKRALQCIREQSVKPDYIFVVDDGSSCPLTMQGQKEDWNGVTIIRLNENCGPATGRNEGLKAARDRGVEFVCFTDSDCLPQPRWIEHLLLGFKNNPDAAILTGNTKAEGKEDHPFVIYHNMLATWNPQQMPDGSILYCCTCNTALRLKLVRINFSTAFREAAAEDIDFCVRAREKGLKTLMVKDALVLHDCCTGLVGFFFQIARYGRSQRKIDYLYPFYAALLKTAKNIPT